MRVAEQGKNYAVIRSVEDLPRPAEGESKFHLIKLELEDPTEEQVNRVFQEYPETKRFIVNAYIRFYNGIFKRERTRKFYVENRKDDNLFVYFKKNNKIAVNLDNLRPVEFELLADDLFLVLNYVEVVVATAKAWKRLYELKGEKVTEEIIRNWKGNVVFEQGKQK
jgi:hypothetical protein